MSAAHVVLSPLPVHHFRSFSIPFIARIFSPLPWSQPCRIVVFRHTKFEFVNVVLVGGRTEKMVNECIWLLVDCLETFEIMVHSCSTLRLMWWRDRFSMRPLIRAGSTKLHNPSCEYMCVAIKSSGFCNSIPLQSPNVCRRKFGRQTILIDDNCFSSYCIEELKVSLRAYRFHAHY